MSQFQPSSDSTYSTSPALTLRRQDPSALEALNNPLQSALWALYKERMGQGPVAFRAHHRHGTFDLLVLLTRVADERFAAYLPWAPNLAVAEEEQGVLLEELAEALRGELPDNTVYLRFDLPWHSPYEDAEPPQQLRELRMNFTTQFKLLRKAASDVQPVDTVVIDTDATDSALLSGMHKKTRYNVRLAQQRGVETHEADPRRELDAWYELYRDTMARKGLTVHAPEHFRALFDADAQTDPSHRVSLLFATVNRERAAAIITVESRGYALYLYGATDAAYRGKMPAYALQWEAMRWARERGAAHYDLYGIPSDRSEQHPMHGLLRFKQGFGGRIVRRRGCWDYPLLPDEYERLRGHELGVGGYYA